MRSWYSNDIAKGAMLGVIAFVLVLSSFPLANVNAAASPYFSMTLLAPTSNPQRRQWAAIIQNSFASANIDAKLIYVSFSQMLGVILNCTSGCPAKAFAQGGWDANFVGFGGGTSLPDFGTQNVANYRNEGPGDIPPVGSDYYFFKNATLNALSDDYNTNFNAAQRLVDAQKIVKIAAQERPSLIIYYPQNVYAFSNTFKAWGTSGAYSAVTSTTFGLDWAHWNTGSQTTVNVAVTGNLDNVNQIPTGAQNSLYDRFIYGPTGDQLEQADARGTGVYFNSIANSITSSSDHKTWTVTFKAHNFQDGVPVTADDYVFTFMSQLRLDVGWTGTGTITGLLSTSTTAQQQFTFSNGTTRYVNNGTYSLTKPATWNPTSVWTSLSPTSFSFTMPAAYILTDPIITATGALPMHIYEKVPASTWSTGFLSGFTGSSGGLSTNHVTVTWSTAKYGGNGSYAWVFGPVADGPYTYRGYDPVSQTAFLTKWSGYWNATGLQGLGQFTVTTIHVQSILAKDAAIAAFGNKQINALDDNYVFNPADAKALTGLGATVVKVSDPANGYQEMGLNLNAPVWGTGVGTPLGASNPAKAAFAARSVRHAFSLLIPRQQIINNLVGGLGAPGITAFYPTAGVITGGDIYVGVTADPYDPVAAASFFAAAGYQTGVAPPTPGQTVTLPTTTIVVPGSTVAIPSFLFGNSFTLSGIYQPVNVATELKAGGFAVVLEQSVDSGTSWQAVSATYTNVGGFFTLTYTPTVNGSAWYRLFYSGVPVTYLNGIGYGSPASIEAVTPPTATLSKFWQNTTATSYGPTSKLTIGTFGQVVTLLASGAQLQSLGTQLQNSINALTSATQASLNTLTTGQTTTNGQVSALQASLNTANTNISNLQGQVSTLQNVAYAALAVAVVLGLLAIGLSRRKPS